MRIHLLLKYAFLYGKGHLQYPAQGRFWWEFFFSWKMRINYTRSPKEVIKRDARNRETPQLIFVLSKVEPQTFCSTCRCSIYWATSAFNTINKINCWQYSWFSCFCLNYDFLILLTLSVILLCKTTYIQY